MITDDELREAKRSIHQVDMNLCQKIYKKSCEKEFIIKRFPFHFKYVASFCIILLLLFIITLFLNKPNVVIDDNDSDGIIDENPNGNHDDDTDDDLVKGRYNHYQEYMSSLLGTAANESIHISNRVVETVKSNVATIEKSVYTVTVNYNYSDKIEILKVKAGDLVYPEIYSRSGYYFCGWYYNNQKLTRAIEVYDDISLTAIWSQYFTIEFNGNTYKYIKSKDGVSIIDGKITTKNLFLPNTIEEFDVIGIEACAFSLNNGLESVQLPENLEYIAASAFWKCAFKTLYFPKTVEYISPNAFSQSRDDIIEIIVDKDNPFYTIEGNCLIDIETKTIVLGCNNSIIPNDIEEIDIRAFDGCTKLKNVTLPNTLKKIGIAAFENCTSLEKIAIPEGIDVLPDSVFNNCVSLQEIILPASLIDINNYNFNNCIYLEKILVDENNPVYVSVGNHLIERETKTLILASNQNDIPDVVEIIGNHAFMGRNFKSITIPGNVKIIKSAAFMWCKNLEEVIIEEGVIQLEGYIFYDCSNLHRVSFPHSLETIGSSLFDKCTSLQEITLPEHITGIPDFTFSQCSSLEKVNTLGIITKVDDWAFISCAKLTDINISHVTYFGDDAFGGCNALAVDASTLSNDITYIGNMAFFGTLIYGELNLPNIEYLGSGAFRICKNLTSVTISSSLKKIEKDAFTLCYSLENVVLNDGLEVIGTTAFATTKINNITIPSTVTEMEYGVFYNCENLVYVIIPASVMTITSSIVSSHTILYCQAISKPNTWSANWNSYNSKVYFKDEWSFDENSIPIAKEILFYPVFDDVTKQLISHNYTITGSFYYSEWVSKVMFNASYQYNIQVDNNKVKTVINEVKNNQIVSTKTIYFIIDNEKVTIYEITDETKVKTVPIENYTNLLNLEFNASDFQLDFDMFKWELISKDLRNSIYPIKFIIFYLGMLQIIENSTESLDSLYFIANQNDNEEFILSRMIVSCQVVFANTINNYNYYDYSLLNCNFSNYGTTSIELPDNIIN